jgi:hypothetical protein
MIVGAHRGRHRSLRQIHDRSLRRRRSPASRARAAALRVLGEPDAAENWERVKSAIERLQAGKL